MVNVTARSASMSDCISLVQLLSAAASRVLKQSVLIEKFIFFIKCVLFGVRGAYVPAAKLICFVCSVSDYVRFFRPHARG